MEKLSKSLKQFTSDIGEYVNAYIQGEEFPEQYRMAYEDIISDLDSAFVPSEKDIILCRGIECEPFKNGSQEVQKGYFSTFRSFHNGRELGKYILMIDVPKGTPIIDVDDHLEPEHRMLDGEVILTKNSKLELYESGKNVYYCRVV